MMLWFILILLLAIAVGCYFYFRKPKCNPDDAPTKECIEEAFRENAKENKHFIQSQLNSNPKVKMIPMSDQKDLENILKDFQSKETNPPSTLPVGMDIKTNKELNDLLKSQSKTFQTNITTKINTVSAKSTEETNTNPNPIVEELN